MGASILSSDELLLLSRGALDILLEHGITRFKVVVLLIEDPLSALLTYRALLCLSTSVVLLSYDLPSSRLHTLAQLGRAEAFIGTSRYRPKLENSIPFISVDNHTHKSVSTFPHITYHPQATTSIATSGTSQAPRLVTHSRSSLAAQGAALARALHMDSSSRVVLSLPLSHISGLSIFHRALEGGSSLVVPKVMRRESIISSINGYSSTHVSLVPSLLSDLKAESKSSLQIVLLGGASVTAQQLASASHLPLCTSYGSSETSAAITLNTRPSPDIPHNVGRPLPHVHLSIQGHDNRALLPGERGQIRVKSPTLFQGYNYQRPDTPSLTAWNSSDEGAINEDSELLLYGRIDSIINSGGIKIHPEEIQRIALLSSDVSACAVLKVPDKLWGESAHLIIESINDQPSLLIETIKQLFSLHLPSTQHPRAITVLPKLPLLPHGKVDLESLRDIVVEVK
jgi:o-succinylbenzoate---CoA ligase